MPSTKIRTQNESSKTTARCKRRGSWSGSAGSTSAAGKKRAEKKRSTVRQGTEDGRTTSDFRVLADEGAISRNKQILELGNRQDWRGILKLYDQTKKGEFDNINFATTMSQLGKIRGINHDDPILIAFLGEVSTVLEHRGLQWMGIRGTENIVHAVRKMGLRTESAKLILTHAKNQISEGGIPQTVDLENIPQATQNSKATHRSPRAMCHQTKSKTSTSNVGVRNYKSRTLSVKGGIRRNRQILELGSRHDWKGILLFHERERDEFDNVNYATMMNQLGKLRDVDHSDPSFVALLDEIAGLLESKGIKWMGARGISNIVHALGKMGLSTANAKRILKHAEKFAVELVAKSVPQDISNIALAFATIGTRAPKLFTEIEKRAETLVETGKPQEIANTAWAFSTLGVQAPRLFAQIDKHASKLVITGNPQNIEAMAWACAIQGVRLPKLFAAIEQRSVELVETGKPRNIANTAWACAKLGIESPKLFTEIKKRASKLTEKGIPQDIASICYALVVLDLGQKHQSTLSLLWKSVMTQDPDAFSVEDLRQLALVFSFAMVDGIGLTRPPESLLRRMQCVVSGDARSSTSQREVSLLLNELGFDHEVELPPLSGTKDLLKDMLSIDVASQHHMVAIEFDGPTHFLRALQTGTVMRQENGPTQAKRRFLKKLGWKVINIHYLDWIDAGTKQHKRSYLGDRLEGQGIQCT